MSVFEFVMHEVAGLLVILDFMEMWERELPKVPARGALRRHRVARATMGDVARDLRSDASLAVCRSALGGAAARGRVAIAVAEAR